ncbi:hypothetical protein [Ruminococcus sp.]|uniref:hypothetical protein n=1 Tax=Ruminococcus sp. TaxID=41978 RepID=UPI0015A0DCF4|nr:hypothetical protein [Ruminococcus sp.]DAZ61298.1 MAG TPA: hypothetical protein [Caudoviricetes sp.]
MDRLTKKLCQTTVYVGEESKLLVPAELSVGQTREVLQKLCEYEETGLSPDEVIELKKSADIKVKNQRTKILGIVKPTVLKQRVSRYGLHINGKKYYLPDLALYHIGEIATVTIYKNNVKVFIDNSFVEEFEL